MKMGVQSFQGARLRQARLARGLYMNALGDLVGVSGTAISRYEEGIDKPQEYRVELIAKYLGFSESFFLKPESYIKPGLVFWRARSAETKHAREMAEPRMQWMCEIFDLLEREVDFPLYALPEVELPNDFRIYTNADIERAAEQIRKHWKLWDNPIPDVVLALENAGIPVVMMDFGSDKQDGFYFPSDQLNRVFVGINSHDITAVRARFDAAHELGHAVLHQNVTRQQSRDPHLFKLIEQQAHRFAGALLFPEEAFKFEVRAPSLDYFCSLKKRWGISIAAMIYRAHDLGMISDEERSLLYRNMGRRGWRGRRAEPYDRPGEMTLETPRMLRRAVDVVLQEGLMSKAALQTTFPLPSSEIERIAGLQAGYFDTSDTVELVKPKRGLQALDLESGNIIEFPRRGRG